MADSEHISLQVSSGVAIPTSADLVRLHALAERARQHAYAPYSALTIGAAIQWDGGDVVTGANVENGSYGLTICAERVAATGGAASGHRQIEAIVVAGDLQKAETLSPCGACRQVLTEFDPARRAVVAFPSAGGLAVWYLSDLLPADFRLRS